MIQQLLPELKDETSSIPTTPSRSLQHKIVDIQLATSVPQRSANQLQQPTPSDSIVTSSASKDVQDASTNSKKKRMRLSKLDDLDKKSKQLIAEIGEVGQLGGSEEGAAELSESFESPRPSGCLSDFGTANQLPFCQIEYCNANS